MQLFALEDSHQLVPAAHAVKQRDYFCLECSKIVRLRGGVHRQDHFYHIQPNLACRQSQKSLEHLQVQWFLSRQLPEGEWELEKAFPEIARIADLVWEAKKIIFEVQCSPITSLEVEQRNRDYGTLGYQVIWILHEQRFNRFKVSGAELFLQEAGPYYFTDIDAEGNGKIYDQLHVIDRGRRCFKRRGNAVSLSSPQKKEINERLFFSGDFVDRIKNQEAEAECILKECEEAEKRLRPHRSFWKSGREYIFRFCLNAFRLFLQKCCRG